MMLMMIFFDLGEDSLHPCMLIIDFSWTKNETKLYFFKAYVISVKLDHEMTHLSG